MRNFKWIYFTSCALLTAIVLSCAPVDPSTLEEEGTTTSPQKDVVTFPEFLTPEVDKTKPLPEVPNSLKARIEAAVNNIRARDLTFNNGFWTIFHGILGLGPGLELVDPQSKERVKAIDFICNGGNLKGKVFHPRLFGGVEVVSTQDGLGQGHQDQFIAEMAQWGMPADRVFMVDGKPFTFMDFVNCSQAKVRTDANDELSWSIIIVAQYKGLDAKWTNLQHKKITFDDVLRYELDQPIENAACGGTHRLFGLSWVYHMHLQQGGKTEGLWQAVADKTIKYRDLAKKFRNADGTLSTSFFRGPGNDPDKNLRINTTGHVLEWLALALSDEELRQDWVQEAVNALCLQILDLQGAAIDGGGMYHAVHGLLIYHARVFDRGFCPPELLVPLPPNWKQVPSTWKSPI